MPIAFQPFARLLGRLWLEIDFRLGIGGMPVCYPPIVQPVRSDDPARCSQLLDLTHQSGNERRRRMDEETSAPEADDGGTCRKRHPETGYAKADHRTIDDPDPVIDRLQRVQRRISLMRFLQHAALPPATITTRRGSNTANKKARRRARFSEPCWT